MANFYTIGQISAICDISVQGLRYYDKINLLKPSEKNGSNGYRLYSDKDILYLRIIQGLKETGFSLDEIKEIVKTDDIQDIMGVLSKKRQEFQEKLQVINSTLARIDGRIANLQLHNHKSDNNPFLCLEIEMLPARTVAFTRYESSCCHEAIALRFYELDNVLKKHAIVTEGFRMAIYHSCSAEKWDLEVCVPVDGDLGKDDTYIRTIDVGLYATAVYKGEYLGQCETLAKWIEDCHYQIIGPGMEIYLNSFMNTRFPKQFVTKIQFPVKES